MILLPEVGSHQNTLLQNQKEAETDPHPAELQNHLGEALTAAGCALPVTRELFLLRHQGLFLTVLTFAVKVKEGGQSGYRLCWTCSWKKTKDAEIYFQLSNLTT